MRWKENKKKTFEGCVRSIKSGICDLMEKYLSLYLSFPLMEWEHASLSLLQVKHFHRIVILNTSKSNWNIMLCTNTICNLNFGFKCLEKSLKITSEFLQYLPFARFTPLHSTSILLHSYLLFNICCSKITKKKKFN